MIACGSSGAQATRSACKHVIDDLLHAVLAESLHGLPAG